MRRTINIIISVILTAAVLTGTLSVISLLTPTQPTPTSTLAQPIQPNSTQDGQFVTVSRGKFWLANKPYYFMGTNFWQDMNLGVDGPSGDRIRLKAELDHLHKLGVTNLHIMAASEGSDTEPYRMTPALMTAPGVYNKSVLDGLDFLISEMSKREMKAVMVLNNYW